MKEILMSEELKEKLKEVNNNFIEKYGTYLPKDDYVKKTNINKYLFRGKRKDNGKWIEGGYCYCNNKSYIVIATQYIPDTRDWDTANYYEENPVYEPTFIEVYTKTVGQYTGFDDMNDKKVFEGDIVEVSDDNGNTNFNGGGIGTVESFDGLWYINGDVQNGLYDANKIRYIEIIGNIYDNPEMLVGG